MVGTSFALSISDIPWNGPDCRRQRRAWWTARSILNPNAEQRHKMRPEPDRLPVPRRRSCMIECGANEVDNDTMLEAIIKGHRGNTEDVPLHRGGTG